MLWCMLICAWLWCMNLLWLFCVPIIIWMYSHSFFMLLRMCPSGVQIIRYMSRSLILRMSWFLFSCLSIESYSGVSLICNTRGISCLFILFYVAYLSFAFDDEPLFKLIILLRLLCRLFYNLCCLSNDLIFNYVVKIWLIVVWVASYLESICITRVLFKFFVDSGSSVLQPSSLLNRQWII